MEGLKLSFINVVVIISYDLHFSKKKRHIKSIPSVSDSSVTFGSYYHAARADLPLGPEDRGLRLPWKFVDYKGVWLTVVERPRACAKSDQGGIEQSERREPVFFCKS